MDILIEELEGDLWAATLEQGRLEGLDIDPPHEEVRWGSLYYAKVKTIDPALDAVFLDLDGFNTGILYNSDTRLIDKEGKVSKGGSKSISQQFQPGDMIPVQAKSAYIPKSDNNYGPSENKILQTSMDITLPGRYLIYCPFMEENKISFRIRDRKLRGKIKSMMEEMKDIHGCIIRAAAADTQTDILLREGKILKSAWEQIQEQFNGNEAQLIMAGPDAIQRTLSDQAENLIDRIEVATMEHYTMAEEWCKIFAPDLVPKIEPIELDEGNKDLALFHYRDIMGQIEDLFQTYTILPHGGNIIIQDTAALTAIDVNKSSDKRSNLAVNLEAATEIVRQIRLRNIGGMIIIDFLNFKNKKDEGEIISALEKAAAKDPCTLQIHGKTALGLIELSRKRRTPPLDERIATELP